MAHRPPRRLEKPFQVSVPVKVGILIAVCLIIMGPVATALLGSIRTTGEFLARPFDIPRGEIQLQHYTDVLTSESFWNSFRNSMVITGGVTFFNVVLSSLLAFALSRVQFVGRGLLFNILSLGLLFPLVIAILPIFIQVRQLGLINSMWGVILPIVAFGLPGSVVILRGFFISVPNELEDAAYIDGCTTWGFFWHILIPLARPALASVAVLQVIAGWNEFFLPLIVLTDPKLWPLPLGIMQYQGQFGTDWARVMAYVVILMVPAVVFYIFTERYIVTGLTGGELKG
ncbi:MAG: carbohydrate ABC transporter permease [Anaerolineae bacterium]|jgi:raffinose/stachyose/melibiose transport system permease protein|nr:carbohydrate ABC transporter permease [Anaerolineae bacterium]